MKKSQSLKELIKIRSLLPSSRTVILTTGVFDLLHTEHKRFLRKAKREGDRLFVGIEPDTRVRRLKGRGRPVNSQKKRAKAIAAIDVVDCVFILPNNLGTQKGREQFIKSLRPDIYAISTNTPFNEEKRRIMRKIGGELKVVHPHNPAISTTRIIASRQKSQKQNKQL